jgi:hypothetical protein
VPHRDTHTARTLRTQAAASFLEVFRRSPPLFGTGAPARARARGARVALIAVKRVLGGGLAGRAAGAGSASDSPLAELALCQKMFRPKPRRDSRQGTIERDADFKAFVKGLDAAPEKPPDASFDTKEDVPKTAALVEYLRSRKKVRKERMRTDPRRKARDQPAKPTTKEGRGAKKPAAKPSKRKDGAREPAAEARQQRASRATGSDNPRHKEGRKIIARKE